MPIVSISLPAALELVAGLFDFNIATNVDMIARPNNLMARTGEPLPYGFPKMLQASDIRRNDLLFDGMSLKYVLSTLLA